MPSKRVASKKSGHRLRMLADAAWQYWSFGHLSEGESFENEEEERACWRLVRNQYLEWYPPGKVDSHGFVEYGVYAWWRWDTPEPVEFWEIEGLPAEYAIRYQKVHYLKSWGLLAQDVKDEGLVMRATEIATYYRRGFYPHPTGVSDADKAAKWQALRDEQAAWQELGYIGDNDGKAKSRH